MPVEYEVFKCIVDSCKCRNTLLFSLGQDVVCSTEQIKAVERILQIELPEKYLKFLQDFGGGYFGYANVYSLDPRSQFYLLAHNVVPIEEYIRIADNGCGDYYLLKVKNKKCFDQVFFFEHDTATICDTDYVDILDYLVRVGLRAESTEK